MEGMKMKMKVVNRLVELPGGVWVNPQLVELVTPKTDKNGDVAGSFVWIFNGNFTFNGIPAGDIARAINRGIERNTLMELEE